MAGRGHERELSRLLPFWERLPDEQRRFLDGNTAAVAYTAGATVHGGEVDCVGVLLVIEGALRTYMLSEEGREITLYRLFPGDICVLSASCILREIAFDVHVEAQTDCKLLLIDALAYGALCERNVYVENFTYKLTTDRFSDVMWAMQQILFMGFDKRLAIFLMDEASRGGSDAIRATHEQIAKHIGSAREVVTRMLRRFADEGLVQLRRGEIRIADKAGLRKLTE